MVLVYSTANSLFPSNFLFKYINRLSAIVRESPKYAIGCLKGSATTYLPSLFRLTCDLKCSSHSRSSFEKRNCLFIGSSSIVQNFSKSNCRSVNMHEVDLWLSIVVIPPPITQPRFVFCNIKLLSATLIWPVLNEERDGPAPINKSMGAGMWNSGSAKRKLEGNFNYSRGIVSLGVASVIFGTIKNVNDCLNSEYINWNVNWA